MIRNKIVLYVPVLFFLLLFISNSFAQEAHATWPKRVLITNDNGIDDVKIIELARAFSQVAETYVVAPLENRSGSTHYMTITRKGSLRAEPRELGDGIHAYAVDGFPADCVLLALLGIMQDNPPDLVISGINGGPNLGQDWIGSGTIGAARIASFAGFPAMAVSGLNDDIPGAVEAATQWVVRLAQSPVVRELQAQQYLTVSIPRLPPSQIKGIRVTKRAGLLNIPVLTKVTNDTVGGGQEIWGIKEIKKAETPLPSDSDIALYESGYIVMVPMQADEHDYDLLSRLKNSPEKLPEWTFPK